MPSPDDDVIYHIRKKIAKAYKKQYKLRAVGANFGISLYDNQLYQDKTQRIKYISLANFEFDPFITAENTLICHPNNTLAKCYIAAHEKKQMKKMVIKKLFYLKKLFLF